MFALKGESITITDAKICRPNNMDYSLQNHTLFIGKHISALPTPALVISKPVVKANIARLLHDVETVGVGFRPHVKTLKV